MKIIYALWIVVFMTGCAPTPQQIALKMIEIEELGKTQRTIIDNHYGKVKDEKEEQQEIEKNFFSKSLPTDSPEGSGQVVPCSVKCIDNCDTQCQLECPDMWAELCAEEDFDFEEDKTTKQPHPPSDQTTTAKNNSAGNNNNQTNIVGHDNYVLVQGGGGANSTAPDPIEQAMANLLGAKVAPLETGVEIAGKQIRGLIGDTAEAVVKVAPSVLTGAAIITAGKAVEKGFEEAGDRYTNSNNPDNSDKSVETNTDNSDNSVETNTDGTENES